MRGVLKVLVVGLGLLVLVLAVATAWKPRFGAQEAVPPPVTEPMAAEPSQVPSATALPGASPEPSLTALLTKAATAPATPAPIATAALPATPTPVPPPPRLGLLYTETDQSGGKTTLWLAEVKDLRAKRSLIALEHKAGYDPTGAVSPDGRRLAYLLIPPGVSERAARTAGGELWLMDIGSLERRKLADEVGYLAAWSPDSTRLVYGRMVPLDSPKDPRVPFRTELRLVSLKDGSERPLLANDADYALQPVGWDGAGQHFFYAAVDLKGEWRLGALEVASGKERTAVPLPRDLASGLSLSPDGSRVAFLVYKERQPVPPYALMVLPVSGGEAKEVISGAQGDEPIHRYAALWAADGHTLIVHIPPEAGQPSKLEQMDFQAGRGELPFLGEVAPGEFLIPRSASPDGRWLVLLKYPAFQPYLAGTSGGALAPILPAEPSRRVSFLGWAAAGP